MSTTATSTATTTKYVTNADTRDYAFTTTHGMLTMQGAARAFVEEGLGDGITPRRVLRRRTMMNGKGDDENNEYYDADGDGDNDDDVGDGDDDDINGDDDEVTNTDARDYVFTTTHGMLTMHGAARAFVEEGLCDGIAPRRILRRRPMMNGRSDEENN